MQEKREDSMEILPNPQQEVEKRPESVTASKKNVEVLWQILFVAISVVSAVLLQRVYLFQTLEQFADIRKGRMLDILFGVVFAIFHHLYEKYLHKVINPWIMDNYIRFDKYKEPEQRVRRCYFLTKMVYSLAYYTVSSTAAYLLIRNTSMMPTWLGGSGQCINAYIHIPYLTEDTLGMKIFLMVTFGKDLNRLVTHAFIRQEGNFYEYLLHHGLATFLILFSYLMNLWLIGVFIIFIHDFSDLALGLARFYLVLQQLTQDYRHKRQWILSIIYVVAFSSWVGCRIITHVSCCCYPVPEAIRTLHPRFSELELYILYIPGLFMASMVYCLEILHLFWTYYILKSFLSVNVSSKVTHTYD